MLLSLNDPLLQSTFAKAAGKTTRTVKVGSEDRTITAPFPSPQDWRDVWIYFLMLDRFNRSDGKPPARMPHDKPFGEFQGGTFNGVRDRLHYIKDLGDRGDLALTRIEEPPIGPRYFPWLRHPRFPPARAEVCVRAGQGG